MNTQKIFVGSIPGHVSEDMMTAYFKYYAPSAIFTLKKKSRTGLANCGFGFVTVESDREIAEILSVPHFIEGRAIKCQERLSGVQLELARNHLNQRRLFLKGFPNGLTDSQLHAVFEQYGEVESAYTVRLYSTKKEKRIAYVTMKDAAIAHKLGKLGLMTIYGHMVNISPFSKLQQRLSYLSSEHHQEMYYSQDDRNQDYDHQHVDESYGRYAKCSLRMTKLSSTLAQQDQEPETPFHPLPNCQLEIRNPQGEVIFPFEKEGSATSPSEASSPDGQESSGPNSGQVCPKHCHKFKHHIKPTTRSYCFDRICSANHGAGNLVLNTANMNADSVDPLPGLSMV